MAARNYLDREGFFDIETPILTKSTPEGARDFLRRLYAEQFCNFWRFLFSGQWYASLRGGNNA